MVTSPADLAEASLDEAYAQLCGLPSDIHEHLPLLRELASSAAAVVELGMRTGVSALALAAGRPAWLTSVDVDQSARHVTRERFRRAGFSFQGYHLTYPVSVGVELVLGSSLKVERVPCDLLFIDSLHTYDQLVKELERWSPVTRKTIALHDTVTFGKFGEDDRTPGLMGAVRFWLRQGAGFRRWRVRFHRINNNGLLVLDRYAPEPGKG